MPISVSPSGQAHIDRASRVIARLPVILACLLVFIVTLGPEVDFDLWFDIKMGQTIAETRSIPHKEIFLNSIDHFPPLYTINDEWGFCYITWIIYKLSGHAGLALLKSFLITATFFLLYCGCRVTGVSPIPSLAWLCITFIMIESRFMLRPQLLSMMLLALLLLLLLRHEKNLKSGLPWIVIPVFLFWTNCHGGVMAGLVLLAIWLIGEVLSKYVGKQGCPPKLVAASLGIAMIVTVLRPGMWNIYEYVYGHIIVQKNSMAYIIEWDPPGWSALWGPFGLYVLFSIIGFALSLRRKTLRLPHLFCVSAFIYFATKHNRSLGELSVMAPIVIGTLSACLPDSAWEIAWQNVKSKLRFNRKGTCQGSPGRHTGVLILSNGLIALILLSFLVGSLARKSPFDFSPSKKLYPIGSIEYIKSHPPRGNLFNSYHFGGYLVFSDIRPFIHGITSAFPEEIFDDYLAILGENGKRWDLMKSYDLRACLLAYPIGNDTHLQFMEALAATPEWHLVYWDDASLLYVRDKPQTPPYTAVNPALRDPFVSGDLEAAEKELLRYIESNEHSQVARRLLAELELRKRRPERAEIILNAIIEDDQEESEAYMKRGVARFQLNNIEGALADLKRAMRLDPHSAVSCYNIAIVYVRLARKAQSAGDTHKAGRYLSEALRATKKAVRLDPAFQPAVDLLREMEKRD